MQGKLYRTALGASGSLAHPGAHPLSEIGDEREKCFVLDRLRDMIGEEEGFVNVCDKRCPRDLAIEIRDHDRNDQRFGVDEGREAESARFERQRRAFGHVDVPSGQITRFLPSRRQRAAVSRKRPPPLLRQ